VCVRVCQLPGAYARLCRQLLAVGKAERVGCVQLGPVGVLLMSTVWPGGLPYQPIYIGPYLK
jgi:hypothetical protein